MVVWEGAPEDVEALADRLGCDILRSARPEEEILRRLHGTEILFFETAPDSAAYRLGREVLEAPGDRRLALPQRFGNSDLVLAPLRLRKDADEIRAIRRAAKIAAEVLEECLPLLVPGIREFQFMEMMNAAMRVRGCEPSFDTIVASGVSAATLHYRQGQREIAVDQLLLVDWGVELSLYASDITRTFPVSGRFSPIERKVYEVVLAAQTEVIRAVKPGAKLGTLYDRAVRVLTEGLVSLKVLKGRVPKLIETGAYKPYFPHRIGHSLGLDVHDGFLHRLSDARLEPGMVITIEPALYFPEGVGKVHPLGIRIEDDVVVTAKGCELLTPEIPKDPEELCGWVESCTGAAGW
jgi:Xaa-Pro aminopeptidase